MATEPSSAGTYVMRSCDVPGQKLASIGPWRAAICAFHGVRRPVLGRRWLRLLAAIRTSYGLSDKRVAQPRRSHGGRQSHRDRAASRLGQHALGHNRKLSPGRRHRNSRRPAGCLQRCFRRVRCACSDRLPRFVPGDYLGLDADMRRVRSPASRARADGLSCRGGCPTRVAWYRGQLREDVAPAGLATGGTLLGELPVSGVRTLDYSVSDEESGVAKIEVLIADKVAATRNLSGRLRVHGLGSLPEGRPRQIQCRHESRARRPIPADAPHL